MIYTLTEVRDAAPLRGSGLVATTIKLEEPVFLTLVFRPLWESLTPFTILCSGEARDASVVPERPHGNPLKLEEPVVTLTLVSVPCGRNHLKLEELVVTLTLVSVPWGRS